MANLNPTEPNIELDLYFPIIYPHTKFEDIVRKYREISSGNKTAEEIFSIIIKK